MSRFARMYGIDYVRMATNSNEAKNWQRKSEDSKTEERVFGKNLKVSAVGLGCMGFSHAYGAPTESAEAIRMMNMQHIV